MKAHVANVDQTRRKIHILGTGFFCTSQQAFVKHFILQRDHCITPYTTVPIFLNRIEHMPVEMGIMGKTTVTTIKANSLLDSIMQITATAAFDAAKIMGHRVKA